MKKKQKDNLIKAFEELNEPDKDVLLQKIEGKKAFGGEFVEQEKQIAKKATHKKCVAWTSFACSFVVIVLALVLISISVFGKPNKSDNDNLGSNIINYRNSWNFKLDGNISFGEYDKTVKDSNVDLVYDYSDDWTIIETQVTQDESAYREYYSKDNVTVEVTILLEQKVTSIDVRYYSILSNSYNYTVKDNYAIYRSSYLINGARKLAYLMYLEDQVYIFTSDVDLKDMFE